MKLNLISLPLLSFSPLILCQQKEVRIHSLSDLEKILTSTKHILDGRESVGRKPNRFIEKGRSLYASILTNIEEYGCWCYFDTNFNKAKGIPRDAHDSACKKYHHSLQCIMEELSCIDPHNLGYTVIYTVIPGQDDEIDCNVAENNDCQKAACHAQTTFLNKIIEETLVNKNTPDYANFSAKLGSFDHKAECTTGGTHAPRELMCCGDFTDGDKQAFMVESKDHMGCCKKADSWHVYDTIFNECCENGGGVAGLGSC